MKINTKSILLGLGGLLILIAAGITIFLIDGSILLADAKKQASIAEIPLSLKDIEKIFSENHEATQNIEAALAYIITPQGEEYLLPLSGSGQGYWLDAQMPSLQARTLTSFIEHNDSFFKKMDSISNFNQVRLVTNYGEPDYRKIFQKYIDSRKIINLYCDKTEAAIIARNPKQALAVTRHGLLAQNILLHEPFFIFNYRYVLFINIWVNTSFNRLINNFVLSDDELKIYISDLSQCEKNIQQSFLQALYGEVFYFCQMVDKRQPAAWGQLGYWLFTYDANKYKFKNKSSIAMKFWLFLGGDFEKVAMINNAIEVKQHLLNFDNYLTIKDSWEKFNQSQEKRMFAPFCRDYIDLYSFYKGNLYTIASIHCAATATAAILYKHKYGKYPENLINLTPELIQKEAIYDPYSGELLQMKYGALHDLPNTNLNENKIIHKTGLTISAPGYKELNPKSEDIKFIVVDQQKK
jgi:hypothetical protein